MMCEYMFKKFNAFKEGDYSLIHDSRNWLFSNGRSPLFRILYLAYVLRIEKYLVMVNRWKPRWEETRKVVLDVDTGWKQTKTRKGGWCSRDLAVIHFFQRIDKFRTVVEEGEEGREFLSQDVILNVFIGDQKITKRELNSMVIVLLIFEKRIERYGLEVVYDEKMENFVVKNQKRTSDERRKTLDFISKKFMAPESFLARRAIERVKKAAKRKREREAEEEEEEYSLPEPKSKKKKKNKL